MGKLDKYTNRDDKPVKGDFSKKVLNDRKNSYADSKQHGKIKAPLAPASSKPKAASKEQAQKQHESKMNKYTKSKSTAKPPPTPSRGR